MIKYVLCTDAADRPSLWYQCAPLHWERPVQKNESVPSSEFREPSGKRASELWIFCWRWPTLASTYVEKPLGVMSHSDQCIRDLKGGHLAFDFDTYLKI
jgi:hypothetical protein